MPDPSYNDLVDMAHRLSRSVENRLAILADNLATGGMTLGDWQYAMRQELRDAHATFLAIAAGGDRSKVNPDDWLKLGSELQSQYKFLEGFAQDIADGKVTGGGIAARASMYAGSAKSSFWRQMTQDLDIDLPAIPGDGSTPCLGYCYCRWSEPEYEYDENGDVVAVLMTWLLGDPPHGHCDECPRRADEWNPLRIELAVAA